MRKNRKKSELRTVLTGLAPFIVLEVILVSAVFSDGLWGTFFLRRLPIFALLGVPFWFFLGLYIKSANPAAYAGGASDDWSSMPGANDVNPSTGLPTIGGVGSPDIGGNQWGSSSH